MKKGSSYTLESSSWITDQDGEAVQHLQYLPFGERYVDQRKIGWNAPYTFSGKERDQETQYIYFGARYYDSELSVWLSVDPMASKYPSTSPYAYVENNPIKYIDPNGMYKEESDAIKAQAKAANRHGANNVSDVFRNPTTGRYSFRIAKNGFRQTGSVDSRGGIVINKERGKVIKGNFRLGLYNLFNSTGGFFGTADNGQGQETREGDGKQTDLSEITSNMPEPFDENNTQGGTTDLPKEPSTGLAIPDYIDKGKGYFIVGSSKTTEIIPYVNSNDSANIREKVNNDPGRRIIETVNQPYRIYRKK